MTTNNPGVRQYKLMSGYDSMMSKVNRMQESGDGVYVRFDDYEALQAECDRLQAEYEQLVSYTKNGIECFASPCPEHSGINTPPFSEFQERYGRLCLMCVVDERDALRAECEKLRSIISDLKDWDCDVSGGFLSIPVDLRRRMQEAIDAAMEGDKP